MIVLPIPLTAAVGAVKPMSDDFKDLGQLAQNLITRSVSEQIQAAQRYYELALRFGRGELSPQTLYEEYMRFASREAGRYARDLAVLSLNYYSDWFTLNRRYNKHFLEVLGSRSNREAVVAPEDTASSASSPRRVEIELHAPPGQEAIRSFVLENRRGGVADISFIVSDFVGPAGTTPFRPPLQIQPAQFTLAPGEESVVTLRLMLLAELFVPGQSYTATVVVRGYDNLELGLTVWADAPVQPATETPSSSTSPTAASDTVGQRRPKRRRRQATAEDKDNGG